jgi:hypothetical protein
MGHSGVIKRKDKSSAAEGEALPGYGKQQRILNWETCMPTRPSNESPKKDRQLVRGQEVFVPEGLALPTLIGDVPNKKRGPQMQILFLRSLLCMRQS